MTRYLRPLLAAVALLALAVPASSEEIVKHTGTVVTVDEAAGRLVLAEVGPWQLRDGETVLTYRTIELMPTTQYAVVGRVSESTAGFPGDFVEAVVEAVYILEGDFVTVECRHEGKRMLALKITVAELDRMD